MFVNVSVFTTGGANECLSISQCLLVVGPLSVCQLDSVY